jgi:hypothetical protein
MTRAEAVQKARTAKQEKMVAEWEGRLRRMGMGVDRDGAPSKGNGRNRMHVGADRHARDYAVAPLPDLSHLSPEIAESYADAAGTHQEGTRGFDSTAYDVDGPLAKAANNPYHNFRVFAQPFRGERKRWCPGEQPTNVNYRGTGRAFAEA